MDASDGDQPDDTMRGRVPGSRLRLWLLLEADRWVVAAVPLVAVFGALVVLGAVGPVPLREGLAGADPIETLFQAFVTAIITGVTLVVTINQLVLSQELGAVGDQRERMEEAMAFRRDVEATLDAPVSPPEPSAFLRAIVDAARARAAAVRAAAGEGDDAACDRVDDYVDGLIEHAEDVSDRIEDAQFGTFGVVFSALDFNYSWKIYEARRLRHDHASDLPEEAVAALDDLIEVLEFFGPAREHVKTLYFQWELVDLSRSMLYASVPALLVAIGGILYLDAPGTITGGTAGVANLVWIVSAAATVALVPFAVLLAYVLRIATVAKRTLAIGPFILRESARGDQFEWGAES